MLPLPSARDEWCSAGADRRGDPRRSARSAWSRWPE